VSDGAGRRPDRSSLREDVGVLHGKLELLGHSQRRPAGYRNRNLLIGRLTTYPCEVGSTASAATARPGCDEVTYVADRLREVAGRGVEAVVSVERREPHTRVSAGGEISWGQAERSRNMASDRGFSGGAGWT
jgi:hypothetical protein